MTHSVWHFISITKSLARAGEGGWGERKKKKRKKKLEASFKIFMLFDGKQMTPHQTLGCSLCLRFPFHFTPPFSRRRNKDFLFSA